MTTSKLLDLAANRAARGEEKLVKSAPDSDSGHELTQGSSSGSCSLDEQLEQDPELFVDAEENLELETESQRSCSPGDELDLRRRLAETIAILRKALNNEFEAALQLCSRRADSYSCLAHAALSFLRVALTMEPDDLQAAVASINRSFEVSGGQRRRSPSAAAAVMSLLYRPNYDAYTDDQVHAELVHAESLLMVALVSFLADQSIICLVRGAFRIRTCYQRYKECLHILETRKGWASDEARRHFESGVRMGLGIFNLLMSYMPRRVLRFLQYVGFSGNRSLGVEELERSVALDDGLRSVFSTLVILTYHSYVENLFGLGSYDAAKVEQLNSSLLAHYPNSAFHLLFRGRYEQMQGNLAGAVDSFQRCIAAQSDWKQFHAICHWEIMWCHAVQMDWLEAARYADLLRNKSKWSPASYTYQYATFLYAQLVDEQRSGRLSADSGLYADRMREIRTLMERVPSLRIRYAGKTIPAEKFAITRAASFCAQDNRLSLPALEFLYIWNVFATMRGAPEQARRLLARVELELEHVRGRLAGQPGESVRQDDLCLLLLLRGMCLKHSAGRLASSEAEASFRQVVENEGRISSDTFLVPHAAMELAILALGARDFDQAKSWVKLARNNYTGYLLETIVHFRLHAASRAIRLEQQELELSGSSNSLDTKTLNEPP